MQLKIAAKIRTQIKTAIQDGTLPTGLKTSVRYKRYSGGSSIDITVTAWPSEAILEFADTPRWPGGECFEQILDGRKIFYRNEPCVRAVLDWLNDLLASYNHDGSDSMSDYFDVKFYGNACIDWRLHNAAWTRGIESLRKTA